MTRLTCGAAAALMFLSLAATAPAQQLYLYVPKAIKAEEATPSPEEVLVREVPVLKGDTLSAISRKFSGRASYFPQILLFNQIKNPDLIYAGDTLRVPVSKGQPRQQEGRIEVKPERSATEQRKKRSPGAGARKQQPSAKSADQPVTELSLKDLKKTEETDKKKSLKQERRQAKSRKRATAPKKGPAEPVPLSKDSVEREQATASGQKLFESAVKAYRQDDCRTALVLFDRFLADHPASPLAADASLYKADCYLKQSRQ